MLEIKPFKKQHFMFTTINLMYLFNEQKEN